MSVTATVIDWNTDGRRLTPEVIVWDACGNELHAVRAELAGGAVFEPHSHPQEQIILVVEGEIEITSDDQSWVLGPGMLVHLPSNVPHGARVLSSGAATTLELFTPPREDLRAGGEAAFEH